MSTSKPTKPPPVLSSSVSPTHARNGPRPRRPRTDRLQANGLCQSCNRVITVVELDCDPANIAELLNDDPHYRAETCGYFWGYFD